MGAGPGPIPARGPSFVEVESACIVDGLFHSLALLC